MRKSITETLRFELNVPVDVALQSEDGVVVAGRYGDRVMYPLKDSRTMYVAPFVAQRIRELGIRAGEPFKICKRYVKTGRSKTVNWLVERLDQDGETQLERDLRDSIEIANSKNESANVQLRPSSDPRVITLPGWVTKASDLQAKASEVVNGAQNDHATSSAPPASDDGNQRPPDTQLVHALKTAIAAAVEAEKFAKTLDYNIRFTTDDVRSMGITILIGMQQRQK